MLAWGASGGFASMAVQLCATAGANAIGVICDDGGRDFVMSLGAKAALNRSDVDCWGQSPKVNGEGFGAHMKDVRTFGKAIWSITGKGKDVDIVFEHPGEMTFPVSRDVVNRGAMVVFCAGTTGFTLTFGARFVWMRQKRIQGGHFAHAKESKPANQLVIERRADPCMSEVFSWADIPKAHAKVLRNQHKPSDMAVMAQAMTPGRRTLEDRLES